MEDINVGLIGFGTVGTGVVRMLKEKANFLKRRVGLQIKVKRICDKNIRVPRGMEVEKGILTTEVDDILDDPDIQIVLELIGGINPAKAYIERALKSGKSVVTANKALLAEAGQDLFDLATELGRDIYFEASVAGGIPIIKSLREGLISNRINLFYGIINGTSNFVLSKMTEDNCRFKEALLEAKRKGFAERDPSLDIKGIDSAHKLVILTYLSFGKFIRLKDIFIEGISDISLADVRYAHELGYAIKLLAIAKRVAQELEVRVHPTLVPKGHPLSSVSGPFNAIYLEADLVGKILFFGPGAGQMPTTSAVIADLVDLARNIKSGTSQRVALHIPHSVRRLRRIEEIESRYYIRFMAIDRPGVLASISSILGRHKISIASVSQKESRRLRIVPIVMVTHRARERDFRLALKEIDRLSVVKKKTVAIRMEEG